MPFIQEWESRANCKNVESSDIFFPEHGAIKNIAKQFCKPCPVQKECFELGLEVGRANNNVFGMWGGVGATELRKILDKERKQKMTELDQIYEEYQNDPAFDELSLHPEVNFVPGMGKVDNPTLMIIGEAPGQWENYHKTPFVGDSGILLDKMLKVSGINKDEVFITNSLHYRPTLKGYNRQPTLEELADSFPYFVREWVALGRPRIVTLGRIPLRFVGGSSFSKRSIHDYLFKVFFIDLHNAPAKVYPTYHPSYVLRNTDLEEKYKEHWRWIGEQIIRGQFAEFSGGAVRQ